MHPAGSLPQPASLLGNGLSSYNFCGEKHRERKFVVCEPAGFA